jgi:fatty acid synthase
MKNIKAGFPGIVSIADRLAASLTAAGPCTDVDVNNMFMRYAMDITGVVGFAKDFGTTGALVDAETDSLFDTLRDGMLELYRTATNPTRPLMVWDGAHRKGTAAWAAFKAHMRALVAEVKSRGPPAADDVTIAAHLLRLTDPRTGRPLDDALLAGEFGVYFTAGIESAGNALTWTTFLISQHPEVEAKLVAELAAAGLVATQADPTPRALTYADLNALPYLAWVCKEAMRVKPVASSGTTRTVKRDLVVGGYLIPRGATVLCPFDAVHHLPQNWPDDPAKFMPERWAAAGAEFLPGGDDDAPPGGVDGDIHLHATGDVSDVAAGRVRRFIPFSVGPRQCVGQSLARLMHDGGIAHLYGRFSFALAPRMGGWDGVEAAEINRLTLQPLAGLWMRATPRVGVKAGGGGAAAREE